MWESTPSSPSGVGREAIRAQGVVPRAPTKCSFRGSARGPSVRFGRCLSPKIANSIRPVRSRNWIHGRGNGLEAENDAQDDLRLLWP